MGAVLFFASSSLAGGVSIRSFGHSSLLIKGDGKSVLLNPFKAVGCASGSVLTFLIGKYLYTNYISFIYITVTIFAVRKKS